MTKLTKLAGIAFYNKTTGEFLFRRGTGKWESICRSPRPHTFISAFPYEKHVERVVAELKDAGITGFDPTPLYTTDDPYYRVSVRIAGKSEIVMGFDCQDKLTQMNEYEADTLDLLPKLVMQMEYASSPKGTDGYKMLMRGASKIVQNTAEDASIKISKVRVLELGAPTE